MHELISHAELTLILYLHNTCPVKQAAQSHIKRIFPALPIITLKILALVTGRISETSELHHKHCYCRCLSFLKKTCFTFTLLVFRCTVFIWSMCSSFVILWRLGDVPAITCGSSLPPGSWRAHVSGLCFLLSLSVYARCRLPPVPRTTVQMSDGCRTASSTCDEHTVRTVWVMMQRRGVGEWRGGGVPGRLSSGVFSHWSTVNDHQTEVAPPKDWWLLIKTVITTLKYINDNISI